MYRVFKVLECAAGPTQDARPTFSGLPTAMRLRSTALPAAPRSQRTCTHLHTIQACPPLHGVQRRESSHPAAAASNHAEARSAQDAKRVKREGAITDPSVDVSNRNVVGAPITVL